MRRTLTAIAICLSAAGVTAALVPATAAAERTASPAYDVSGYDLDGIRLRMSRAEVLAAAAAAGFKVTESTNAEGSKVIAMSARVSWGERKVRVTLSPKADAVMRVEADSIEREFVASTSPDPRTRPEFVRALKVFGEPTFARFGGNGTGGMARWGSPPPGPVLYFMEASPGGHEGYSMLIDRALYKEAGLPPREPAIPRTGVR